MKNLKNTKNNNMNIDALTTIFIMSLKLDANKILTIRNGVREILKLTLDHDAEDRDFRNFMCDMCYICPKFFDFSYENIRKNGAEDWEKLYSMFVNFFNGLDM